METQSRRWSGKVFGTVILLIIGLLTAQLVSSYLYPSTISLYLGDGAFSARVAKTDETRTKGLSGTDTLPEDEALLFVFDGDSRWGIWMKDMSYPIDIVWLDDSKKVVDVALNVSPQSYPKVFIPKKDARYVLEFAAGTVKKQLIREGQTAVFSDIRSDS